MWVVNGQDLKMTEGDFGLKLPVTISGATFSNNDEVKLIIKDEKNGNTVITKTFDNITENTVDLEITEAETARLTVGSFVYSLDWYQDGAFMCNIIPCAALKVVDKA